MERLCVRRSWRTNRNCNILTPLLWPSALCLSCSPDAQREAQRPTFFTASYQHLLWTPIQSGAPNPFVLVWLSLPHLVYNSVRSLTGTLTSVLTELYHSSRPLSRLLDLWNHMFNRHQAEITAMQFTGHSLPVHQSMSVSWELFTSSNFISQFPPTRFPLITAIRICHFLPVHHLGMAFLAGSKVKIQQLDKQCKRPDPIIQPVTSSQCTYMFFPDLILRIAQVSNKYPNMFNLKVA